MKPAYPASTTKVPSATRFPFILLSTIVLSSPPLRNVHLEPQEPDELPAPQWSTQARSHPRAPLLCFGSHPRPVFGGFAASPVSCLTNLSSWCFCPLTMTSSVSQGAHLPPPFRRLASLSSRPDRRQTGGHSFRSQLELPFRGFLFKARSVSASCCSACESSPQSLTLGAVQCLGRLQRAGKPRAGFVLY